LPTGVASAPLTNIGLGKGGPLEPDGGADQGSAASLAEAVLVEESARHAARDEARDQIVFPDDLLPGVSAAPMSLRDGLRVGGWFMFLVLTAIASLDQLESAAINVLAPEIQRTFHMSEGAIVFIGTASAAFFVLGAVPMGWLADRVRRVPIAGVSALLFGGFVLASGFAVNSFMLFWTRFFTGISKASTIPVHGSLVADAYPIGVRARMSAAMQGTSQALALTSPVLVAAIAQAAGGLQGWRWDWYLLGIPVSIVAVCAFFMKEPPRGQFEKEHVLHEVIEEARPAPISMDAAFTRLKRIATIRTVLVAFCALGFGLFSQATLASLYLNNDLHVTNVLHRGLILTLCGVGAVPLLPFVGKYFDRAYRRNPARALAMVGVLILPSAIFTPAQFSIHSQAWFVVFGIPQAVLTTAAFAMVGPVLYAVVPYRLRGMGTALTTMYIFFIGGFAGGIIAGLFTNAIGIRATVIALGVPTSIIGALLLMNGARFIRNDLSLVVSELIEENEEHHKRTEPGATVPVLQLADIDFSYGSVQVLYDVNFEVERGEVLALLGTNGAGKSTILRVVSGLEVPERGVVRLNGQNITYVAPEARARLGIIQLPGGKGVFPTLTVDQNLATSARLLGRGPDVQRRMSDVFDLLPELQANRHVVAAKLSGGQQQMLALGRVLLHEPEVLLIDELSLGLAPVVVERMLTIVDTLRERGQTMVIVEQSLNVALSIADRAIFLDKGSVRFAGPARDLLERDDLARAIFFGAEGG
jgi:ABC-type branched-subunit amino acid transport system ATPase component/predicted MFS family arabinose efflux permease